MWRVPVIWPGPGAVDSAATVTLPGCKQYSDENRAISGAELRDRPKKVPLCRTLLQLSDCANLRNPKYGVSCLRSTKSEACVPGARTNDLHGVLRDQAHRRDQLPAGLRASDRGA
jgi:hypothetical protein